jgi:hypothetical protein
MNTTTMVQDGFEPSVAQAMKQHGDFQTVCLASIAVSLKRIADAAEQPLMQIVQRAHHER